MYYIPFYRTCKCLIVNVIAVESMTYSLNNGRIITLY